MSCGNKLVRNLLPNQNTTIINIIWYYFIRYEKRNSINKNQNLLEQSKNEILSTLPGIIHPLPDGETK